MPKYSTKEVSEKRDVVTMTQQEYDNFNKIYKTAIVEKLGEKMNENELKLATQAVGDLKYMILTDGYHRVELSIEKT